MGATLPVLNQAVTVWQAFSKWQWARKGNVEKKKV
jgi:hypothetical protein